MERLVSENEKEERLFTLWLWAEKGISDERYVLLGGYQKDALMKEFADRFPLRCAYDKTPRLTCGAALTILSVGFCVWLLVVIWLGVQH